MKNHQCIDELSLFYARTFNRVDLMFETFPKAIWNIFSLMKIIPFLSFREKVSRVLQSKRGENLPGTSGSP